MYSSLTSLKEVKELLENDEDTLLEFEEFRPASYETVWGKYGAIDQECYL